MPFAALLATASVPSPGDVKLVGTTGSGCSMVPYCPMVVIAHSLIHLFIAQTLQRMMKGRVENKIGHCL